MSGMGATKTSCCGTACLTPVRRACPCSLLYSRLQSAIFRIYMILVLLLLAFFTQALNSFLPLVSLHFLLFFDIPTCDSK